MAIRLNDMVKKWMTDCETVEAVLEKLVVEQLLNAMQADQKVWVSERKPKTGEAAGELADDYTRAREYEGTTRGSLGDKKNRSGDSKIRCHTCGKEGHVARNCFRRTEAKQNAGLAVKKENEKRDNTSLKKVKCYNCGGFGHYSTTCPEKSLYCREGMVQQATRKGVVEGKDVADIVLDTGCSRTMVRRDLVREEKHLDGEAVTVRCAHGDTVLYPLAEVEIELDGVRVRVKAAVADRLPVSVLLGTDVPEMKQLLWKDSCTIHTEGVEEALVVRTRAQVKKDELQEAQQRMKEKKSGVKPTPIDVRKESTDGVEESQDETEELLGSTFAEELFLEDNPRHEKQSRKQKRCARKQYGLVRAKDGHKKKESVDRSVSGNDLRRMQKEDETLKSVRKAAEGKTELVDSGYYEKDGLLYRRWIPAGGSVEEQRDQIVLPKECRQTVLHLAHTVPFAGHLGKRKTAMRILNRFYWPTLFRDVADFCRSCEDCQKCSRRRDARVPMVSIPSVTTPFERIAMDIIGPLPRSRAGYRYVLVVCDYGTRYPEAVPLKSVDAEHIAEELVKLFARVGIPKEILTDQGTNFTSQLLAELYRLLHVKALRTSPYHPQTDGLVERFNQTLKEMLRKTAQEDGKDWDKLIPYVLFAYREVPQESTGFSPFELLYGREVRGPLDVLKETWERSPKSDDSVVSHVLVMRERMEQMATLVQNNLEKAQKSQKEWYDRHARQRKFEAGDQVLVLLPTTTSKLTARWQGPYAIVKCVGKVNYLVNMQDRRKRHRVFHVNMLKKWCVPSSNTYLALDEEDREDIITWKDDEEGEVQFGERLTEEQRKDLKELLREFSMVFQDRPGSTTLTEHSIETVDNKPVRLPPYRLPQAYRQEVQDELREMLAQGIITQSTSDWASPIVLVKKKDGSLRLCMDYRRLNAKTKVDAYPMPRIDDLIDNLGKARYISTLDLSRGYWQVPVEKTAQEKTAFVTPFGLYQFKRMPFGLQGAPATFQRMMDRLLNGLGDYANAYLDDLVIYSETWEEHLQHLYAVFTRLRSAGLTAKPKKCQLGMMQCVYLGHVVGGGKVQPELSKIEAMKQFQRPTTKKEVRTFLGMTGYYRRFIPQYSTIACPLTDLIRKSEPIRVNWTGDCEEAFSKLKACLCSAPVLRSPDFSRTFILQTDASERGVGAVLSQTDDDGSDHPVAYFSRKLLPREERYSVIEKECLAIKLGIQAFRVYLLGRPFVVQTDHRSLEWLDKIKENNARLTRWSLFLQPYQYTVQYRTGKKNANADGLSRGVLTQ